MLHKAEILLSFLPMLILDHVISIFWPEKTLEKAAIAYYSILAIMWCSDMIVASYHIKNNSLAFTPRNGITGSYGSSILIFWGTSILISIPAAPFYTPTNSAQGFQFLYILKLTRSFKRWPHPMSSTALWTQPWYGNSLRSANKCMDKGKCGAYIQWDITQS